MKVLLINPNRCHYEGAKGPRVTLPVGLLSVAAFLEKQKIQVGVFDSMIGPEAKVWAEDTVVMHGVSDTVFEAKIRQEAPQIVGISIPFTAQLEGAVRAAKLVKQINSKIVVVVGGPHVSVDGENLLKQVPEMDYGIQGEGEEAMSAFVEAFEKGQSVHKIPGLIYRTQDNDFIKTNPPKLIEDLDKLPYPAYHMIDMENFFSWSKKGISGRALKGHWRSLSMVTSRGCPFNCIFCSIHLHMGKRYRAHSPSYVLDHLEYVVKKFGVTHIAFEDDNLTFNIQRSAAIFRAVIEKGIKFEWNTPNGIRGDTLDEALLTLMKQTGCLGLTIAPESGSQAILDHVIQKKQDLNKIVQSAALCHRLEIPLTAYFVIGLPGEKKKDMQKTIDFAMMLHEKYGVEPSVFSATPLVGTRLHEIATREGLLTQAITPKNMMRATQPLTGEPIIRTNDFTPEDVKFMARQVVARKRVLAGLAPLKKSARGPWSWIVEKCSGVFKKI